MKLSVYLTTKEITVADFAAAVGDVSASGVRKWVYEERVPRPDQLRRIAEITGGEVTPNDFILVDGEMIQ